MIFNRNLKISLPNRQSAFLLGARKTGKTTLLREQFCQSKVFDLLHTDLYLAWSSKPSLIREEIEALSSEQKQHPIIIDEVQKVPMILDEVHWLIENRNLQFLLCGSSARKLKRAQANLLGGRAWLFHLFPLVYMEVNDFDILRALQYGLIPHHYLSSYPRRTLSAYIKTYLDEEIRAEALSRNLPSFHRFLEAAALSVGNLLVYKNIASEAGVDAKTVKQYFQILEETLVGYHLYPLNKSRSRELIFETPKFYFFDTGVLNFLRKTRFEAVKGQDAGHAFEHWIHMELRAAISYFETEQTMFFWRTKQGQEIDFVIDDVGIEVTISQSVIKDDYKGLLASVGEIDLKRRIVVCFEPRRRNIKIGDSVIEIYPWKEFAEELWTRKII